MTKVLRPLGGLSEREDVDDARVPHGVHRSRLVEKPAHLQLVGGELGSQHLDRDPLADQRLLTPVNMAAWRNCSYSARFRAIPAPSHSHISVLEFFCQTWSALKLPSAMNMHLKTNLSAIISFRCNLYNQVILSPTGSHCLSNFPVYYAYLRTGWTVIGK